MVVNGTATDAGKWLTLAQDRKAVSREGFPGGVHSPNRDLEGKSESYPGREMWVRGNVGTEGRGRAYAKALRWNDSECPLGLAGCFTNKHRSGSHQ